MNISLNEIADLVHGKVVGDGAVTVSALSPIDDIHSDTLVYADGESNFKMAKKSDAAAILVGQNFEQCDKPLIQVENPLKAFISILNHLNPPQKVAAEIHPTAVIAKDAEIGEEVYIGPYVVVESGAKIGSYCVLKSHIHIGKEVVIGEHCTIHSQVTVYDRCRIGSQVTVHSSTVIGSDGFGYSYIDGKHLKIPHQGNVVIEDHVEIGANTAIDRATIGSTVIGEGTKIDNLVQVAHSVKLGKHNILCAFTGIAGSTTSGNNVVFAANVGVSDHVRIDDGVVLGARAGVPPKKHLKQGVVYLGSPARPIEVAIKHELSTNRIPLIQKNIKTLDEKVAQLEKQIKTEEVK